MKQQEAEEYQPDPDELLQAVQKEENKQKLGKLKIFFGMSAGVGKTYAMLEEAQRRLKEGIHIIVGTINTHGRKDTEKLLEGLPLIAEKWIKYKDTVFEEMDLEAILKEKPAIVLVDELAHTNVPGAHHPKRWQDVIEILDAGIDVYTTLNVQHIESRKDLVESFSGIQIRETVPDLILERASIIELVDLSPSELLERLKDGKVYLGDQSQIAARNFFKEDTLTALREIALRLTAEKVDHDLHSILSQGKSWKTREKLMVAIGSSPYAQQLIRKTRRRAFELDAPWVAVYVDIGQSLSDEDQARLNSHLNLAQELGAEVVTTVDKDIASALLRLAKSKNITQLVIGRSESHKWRIFQKSLPDRLAKEIKQVDLLILRQDKLVKVKTKVLLTPLSRQSFLGYILSFTSILGASIIGFLLLPWIGYKSVGFIFLLAILLLSFFVGQGPIFLTAILSTLSWDYFFIPPIFAFEVSKPEDIALILIFFTTAAIIGIFTNRIHKQDQILKSREKKFSTLYEIGHIITHADTAQSLRTNIVAYLQTAFNGHVDILFKGEKANKLTFDSKLPSLQQEKEQAVALWVLENGKIAGWSTSTLPSVNGLYLPIKSSQTIVGILVYFPHSERPLSIPEMNLLQTITQQIAAPLERFLFKAQATDQNFVVQVEKLQTSLLQSVSDQFYPPLNQILNAAEQIKHSDLNKENQVRLQFITRAGRHLQWMIDNLIFSAELESGFVKFTKSKQKIQNFIEECLQEMTPFLEFNPIQLSLPDNPILLDFDPRLMKHALKNLIHLAIIASPSMRSIQIKGVQEEHDFRISVINEGLTFESMLAHIFDKNYPLFNAKFKNEQLGFAIAKSVMNIHHGQIEAHSQKEGGTTFSISIPSILET